MIEAILYARRTGYCNIGLVANLLMPELNNGRAGAALVALSRIVLRHQRVALE